VVLSAIAVPGTSNAHREFDQFSVHHLQPVLSCSKAAQTLQAFAIVFSSGVKAALMIGICWDESRLAVKPSRAQAAAPSSPQTSIGRDD